LKKSALLCALLAGAGFNLVACGGGTSVALPPSRLTTRVFASQSVSASTSSAGLLIIDGENDTLPRATPIGAGVSPGFMALSNDRATLLVYDSGLNAVEVINTRTEAANGSIQLPGPSNVPVTSMVPLPTGFAYAAVPGAPVSGFSGVGALVVLNLNSGGVSATVSVPNAQTVVASPDSTHLLVFSNDSDAVTVVSPLLVNTGVTVTNTVAGFDRPVNAVFSADSSTAYVLNCGAQCGGTQASVQILDMATLTLGPLIPVNGATIAFMQGSTLYVAGTPTASAGNPSPNNACTGETTAATICGRLDILDLGSMTVTGSAVITNGYHDRIDMSSNGQLFIGSQGCETIGNVNNPQGEVRGCLSIFNTTNGNVIIPPDSGDVTGLQSFSSRFVEYVVEGGFLRVYDTTIDKLLVNSLVTTGTIITIGQIVDVKAVDFF
jgi:hypothetical protein